MREQIVATHDLDQASRDLDIARARLETATAEVARYEAQLRKTRLVAPIAGTVIDRQVDTGETVETGDHAFTLANLARLRVDAEADEADAGALAVGAPVAITADGYEGRSWKGTIEEIADAVTLRKLKAQDPGRPTDTRIVAVKVAFAGVLAAEARHHGRAADRARPAVSTPGAVAQGDDPRVGPPHPSPAWWCRSCGGAC